MAQLTVGSKITRVCLLSDSKTLPGSLEGPEACGADEVTWGPGAHLWIRLVRGSISFLPNLGSKGVRAPN